jgi:hypothetical protein
VFLIAPDAQALARWDGAERERKAWEQFERLSHRKGFAGGTPL